jgi:hypothetical protein
MDLLELATRTHQSLNSPSSPTVGVIQYYFRHNIGTLNNLLNSSYVIDAANGAISPDLGEQEGSIFMSLYMIYYWGNKVNESIGAAGYDHVLEVQENGAIVRMVNKNSLALSFIQLKKQEQDNLDNLVCFYRGNNAVPQSIDGEDTTEEFYNGNNGVRIRTID